MNLKKLREDKQLTQQQLADLIGRDRSLIAKIENGDTLPSVETAKAIGRALNFDWTIFFNKIGEDSSHNIAKQM